MKLNFLRKIKCSTLFSYAFLSGTFLIHNSHAQESTVTFKTLVVNSTCSINVNRQYGNSTHYVTLPPTSVGAGASTVALGTALTVPQKITLGFTGGGPPAGAATNASCAYSGKLNLFFQSTGLTVVTYGSKAALKGTDTTNAGIEITSIDIAGVPVKVITDYATTPTRRGPDSDAKACLTPQHIFLLGLKTEKLRPTAAEVFKNTDFSSYDKDDKKTCFYIEEWVENSSEKYDKGELVLAVSVPQAFIKKNKQQSLPANMLSFGETAGFTNYNFNTYQSAYQGLKNSGQFLNLDSGLNMLGWPIQTS